MKIINITHPHSYKIEDFPELVMALGYFDGVHLGHQKVINEAVAYARENHLQSAVMTFDPHPLVVLKKQIAPQAHITPLEEKLSLFKTLGVDIAFVIHFTEQFADLEPQQFVDLYIINLNVKHVVAGFDFTYGRLGKGTMETLYFHARNSFSYAVIPKLALADDKISSTYIRAVIARGAMNELPPLLGRHYTIKGNVIDGDKRGRTIGFPTANIAYGEYLLPPNGVYAVRCYVLDSWYIGVCNVGVKPTFQSDTPVPSVEVHIFNFEMDIYGEEVIVEWHDRIRAEQKFSSIDELKQQINADCIKAQELLNMC
ncbi:bifunctional riboflavin kinase/FAD synthetase [Bacillus sp. HMF5848]|uniref:bifunctional riboflavin kinase/FAD synthetase n=1 Tax=Bacillus sp. HMF5848 TaxID=2495421 RepID=UPI000F768923|nr:bifunctional riboflavin kinase/FAD synthetase [Bacillus sp. HMF5848]RSK27075.1 bifunctional riboflavin kinase/FAD synthetase [Bacillus sp. HMF5848]